VAREYARQANWRLVLIDVDPVAVKIFHHDAMNPLIHSKTTTKPFLIAFAVVCLLGMPALAFMLDFLEALCTKVSMTKPGITGQQLSCPTGFAEIVSEQGPVALQLRCRDIALVGSIGIRYCP